MIIPKNCMLTCYFIINFVQTHNYLLNNFITSLSLILCPSFYNGTFFLPIVKKASSNIHFIFIKHVFIRK